MIELKDINIIFNKNTLDENHALKNINLRINRGDFITVIGSNGAGKSTLYNVIAGTYSASSGTILRETDSGIVDITKEQEYRRARYIGRIFQNPLLGTAGKMSLEDNMVIASKKGFKGLRISLNSRLREEFRKNLSVLNMGLENRLNDNVELFSGGQRQALTLLMAVMSKPDLLLLDEHTAALDPANAAIVMELTKKFAADYNLTVMMAISKSRRSLESDDVVNAMHSKERGILMPLFVRKNKDDKVSKEFYFLGTIEHNGFAKEFIMPQTDNISAVEIGYKLNTPVEHSLYEYITEQSL